MAEGGRFWPLAIVGQFAVVEVAFEDDEVGAGELGVEGWVEEGYTAEGVLGCLEGMGVEGHHLVGEEVSPVCADAREFLTLSGGHVVGGVGCVGEGVD